MVRLTVALDASSARAAQEILDALRTIVLDTRLEPDCLESSTWSDPDGTVHYVEEWPTEEHMRTRVRSSRFTTLLSVIESARESDVYFDFVSASRGLDFVAEVRGG
jgi:hypothetical protein